MEKVSLTINGKQVSADKGKTILQVVNDNHLDEIPTLCHDERIEPYASCYLCAVQVEGLNRLVPSCSTPINEGMVVHTNNDQIRESRKAVLELLMSNHYADCIGPCIDACPASVDAQGYIALISMGKDEEALKLIKRTNPLPLSIGRVCVRNCEDACRRCIVDEPVGINFLKRYVADIDNKNKWQPDKKPSKGKKVAVVGGGPAGLTCAYYLALEGYSPVIYEKLPELGGMLRYGIPEYRLPKEILDSEIQWILDMGVEVKKNVEIGKDIDINGLKNSGYDAVFLSVGAHKATSMGLPGENQVEGVYRGIDFLREVETEGIPKLKGTVVVVGGGNTAIDAARTSLRCGADKVKIVYRRSQKEMPAHHSEVAAAIEEGVEVCILTLPKNIIAENGKLKGIECIKMQLEEGKPGERPRPVPMEGSEHQIECDYLISAIGQQVDLAFIQTEKDFKVEKWGTVTIDKDTYETSIAGVFAGGDVVNGALTAVSAIGDGKKAADSIDLFLRTGKVHKRNSKFYSFKHRFGELSESEFSKFEKIEREKMPELSMAERQNNFREVDLGLSEYQVSNEALRCLECGCSAYYDCELIKYANEFDVNITNYLGDVRKFKVDNRHPFIAFDPNKCINCGKCVRTCSEILEVSALGFVNRGFKAIVKPAMEKALQDTNCIACGNCIDVCPTGAISEKFPHKVLGTLPKDNRQTICNFCSLGCNVNFKVIDNEVFYANNSTEEVKNSKNDGYLCFKGRFGYRHLTEKSKVTEPTIKVNNEIKKATLNEAIKHTTVRVSEIINKYGSDSVAVFASPKLSNEEHYLLQKFARMGLKNNNIGSFSNLMSGMEQDCLDGLIGATVSTTTIDEIKNTDVIVVMNADLEENLIMELKMKDARKRGAKLILISSAETTLSRIADLWIDTRKGTNTVLINGLIHEAASVTGGNHSTLKESVAKFDVNHVTSQTGVDKDKYLELIGHVKDAKTNIVFVYNLDSVKDKSRNDLQAIGNFMSLTDRIYIEKNGLIILREFSNSTGMNDMGANPDYLPGYVKFTDDKDIKELGKAWDCDLSKVFKHVNILNDMAEGKIKAVLLFGEDPMSQIENEKYFNKVEFVMAMDNFETETTGAADVVIPAASFIEQNGTYTSCDTMIQKAKPVINNRNNIENWKVISGIAKAFNNKLDYNSFQVLNEELKKVNRIYRNIKDDEYWNKDAKNLDILKKSKKVDYYTFDIDMSSFNPAKQRLHYSDNYVVKLKKMVERA